MLRFLPSYSLILSGIVFCTHVNAQLTVVANNNGAQLSQLLAGTGIAISNVTLNCPNGACGTFTANGTNLGLGSGVLLTSGSVNNAVGPNNTGSSSTQNNTGGDPQLTALAGMATYDACVLQFSFVPTTTSVSFSYVFGSEEYPEFVNSGYNDAFGFFVNGPHPLGGNYTNYNIALIPNTVLPVTIDNVNAGSFPQYYVNNAGGATIQYDGFTTVLTATLSVIPCSTYTIKLAIADAGDYSYDSGVFLLANSFNSGNFTASVTNITHATCNQPGSATVAPQGGTGPYTYSWNTNPVQTTPTANNLTPGTYTCTVSYMQCNQVISTTVPVIITGPAPVNATISNVNQVLCNGGNTGSATVNATGGNGNYTYNWLPLGGNGATANNLPAGNYTVTVTSGGNCSTTTTVTITEPPVLTAAISNTTQPLCNGQTGNATVNVQGGTQGYTYNWSNGGGTNPTSNNVVAGNYTVTITDANGCTATANAAIIDPPLLTATINNVSQPLCNGNMGSGTVVGNGGTGNYTYNWSNGGGTNATSNNLNNGNYVATVTDANGCAATANVTITQPPLLTVNSQVQNNVSCFGGNNGTASAGSTGGTGNITYLWNPTNQNTTTANNLSAGSYTVTVTDANGCTATSTVQVTEPPVLTAAISNTTQPLCNGQTGNATVSVQGGTQNYTYNWNNGGGTNPTSNNVPAGNYTVTITDANGCTATANAAIIDPPLLTATINNVSQPLCSGNVGSGTVVGTGGTGNYTYNWSNGGGTNATSNNLSNGNYVATVTDANGCTATANVTITQPPLLTVNSQVQNNVSCFGGNNGTASAGSTGGTGNITYLWNPTNQNTTTANNLSAGSYTVTVTDANGCTATSTVQVTEPPVLTAAISNTTQPLCNGQTGNATVSVQGGTQNYTYNWNNGGGTNPVSNNVPAGNYTVTITDANGCTATANAAIIDPPLLTATINNVSQPLCNGNMGSGTVIGTGGTGNYTYNWSNGGGTNATSNVLNNGTYTATVTDANGCTATANVTITQPPLLTVNSQVQNNVSCFGGNNGTASAGSTGGTGNITYLWNPTNQNTTTANNLSAGSYTVTVTDANGCTATSTVQVTQPPILTAAISNTTQPLCNGQTGNATVSVQGGTQGYTYNWNNGGGTNPTSNNVPAGNYTVTITDANGCTATANAAIIDPPLLTATINNVSQPLCNGNMGSGTVVGNGGTGNYTYNWNNGGGTNATSNVLNNGTYTATVTDANGCTATANVTITQPPLLTVNSQVQNNVSCFGGNNGTASAGSTGGTGNITYLWNPTNQNTTTANNLSAGSYTVTVTDANGCTATSTVQVTEPPVLTAAISNTTQPLCYGQTGSSTVTAQGGSGGYTYIWTNGGGNAPTANNLGGGNYTVTVTDTNGCTATASTSIIVPAAIQSLVTSYGDATCAGFSDGWANISGSGGTGNLTYFWVNSQTYGQQMINSPAGSYPVIITDDNNCQETLMVQISEPAPLVINASMSDDSVCVNTPVNFAAAVNGGTGAYTYVWNVGGNTANIQYVPGSACSCPVTITVTDANNCMATTGLTLNVGADPIPSFTLTPACEGQAVTFTSTSSSSAGTITAMAWNYGDQSPVGYGNGSQHTYAGSGTYPVTLTVTTDFGCVASVTNDAVVHAAPVAVFTADQVRGCAPFCFNLSDLTVTGGDPIVSWNWTAAGNAAGSTSTQQVCFPDAGTYDIGLTVTSSLGCSSTTNISSYIEVFPLPIADFATSAETLYVTEPKVQLTNYTVGADLYSWDFGDGATSTAEHPYHHYGNVGEYCITLEATSAQGCKDDNKLCLKVITGLTIYIPNSFTPNGDGVNDVFKVEGENLNQHKDFVLQIFDRWGKLLFVSRNPEIGWDGTYNGTKTEQAVYSYRLEARNEKNHLVEYFGHINLLR